jgi:hypothetical protein
MAGAGYKLFNTGDVLTAAQVNTYLMQQTVMVFADASARTTALSGVLAEGMLSYLQDTNKVYVYDGSAWLDVSSEIPSQTGNSGKYLTTDGTNASWATVSGGGMTLIQETVASGLSSLSFSSIPSTYKHLYLTWSGVYASATGSGFNIRFNNDSTDIYSMRYCTLENGSFSNSGTNGGTMVQNNSNFAPFGWDTTSTTLNNAARGFLFIENYASTSKYKNYNGEYFLNVSGVGFRSVFNHLGLYYTTTAITSVDIYRTTGSATFSNATNTSIRLYGVS